MGKKQIEKKLQKEKTPDCIICMERKQNSSLNCSHQFCYRCITRWAKKKRNCPVCRAEIKTILSGKRRIEYGSKLQTPIYNPHQQFPPMLLLPPLYFNNFNWNYFPMNPMMFPFNFPPLQQ